MLNELRDLARSLNRAGIDRADVHKNFKSLPRTTKKYDKKIKSMSFWLFVNNKGELTGIDEIPLEQIASLRKWEQANGVSFPAFNVPSLFKTKDEIKELRKAIKDGGNIDPANLENIISSSENAWTIIKKKRTEMDRINPCLKIAEDIESQLGDDIPAKYYSIKELCSRAKKMTAQALHGQLTDIALEKLSGATDLRLVDMLFEAGKFQVIFELSDWAQKGYEYPANHGEVQKWMNDRFNSVSRKEQADSEGNDAYGEGPSGKDEKFPSVRLPILGNVILRAMNQESPCQTRYGMIDSDSFHAGDKVRKEMKSALEWLSGIDETHTISNPARKGETWCNLTKRTDKPSLLFAYPTEMPKTPPELAGLLGGTDDNSADPDGARFSAIVQRVTGTLKGIAKGRPDNEIRIFVLAKMDKARTKVLVSRRYTANHLIDSAEKWQEGCRNIPAIKIRQFGKDKGVTLWAEPLVPFPIEVVWCLNTAWRRQGKYAESVHGYSMNDALGLLLDTGPEMKRLACRAIDTVVRNSSPLILAVGQESHSARVFKVSQKFAKQPMLKQPMLLPSIIGLLLYKLDMKGGSMSSPAFLVGRFMNLADKLHLKYCEHVRKGSIPPQLVGNALMSTALEEPVKALSMLSQRILPYRAWANTLKEGEDVGLVRYFLGQLGDISDKLKDLDIPLQCTDADKAQMLLGYLAWSEKVSD